MCSRYGIVVTPEEVRKTILSGLGGGDSDEECIDLMEVVALLLIPALLKSTKTECLGGSLQEKMVEAVPGLLTSVLDMILEDVRCNSPSRNPTFAHSVEVSNALVLVCRLLETPNQRL